MSTTPNHPPYEPDNTWESVGRFPRQGEWTEEDYLKLTDSAAKRIEFTDGRLEFLAMPTEIHQALVQHLFFALHHFVDQRKLGRVYFSGLRVRIRPNKIRLPDIVFLHQDHFHLRHNRVWDGADLLMEVVSDDRKDRIRDFEQKLADYAEGRASEYWIADPERRVVLIHELEDGKCISTAEFKAGDRAASKVLPGFDVDVEKLFAVIDEIPR